VGGVEMPIGVYERTEVYRKAVSDAMIGKNIGELNNNWKGGKYTGCNGYVFTRSLGHPNADANDYVYEHRLVMEEFLGRYLTREEVAHHIDGDKSNNVIENLRLFQSKSAHMIYHRLLTKQTLMETSVTTDEKDWGDE
jgi:uncharacterized protein (DUF1330 family)